MPQNEKTTILGKTEDYASILRWMPFADTELLPPLGLWFRSILGISPCNEQQLFQINQKLALHTIEILETHFTKNTPWSVSMSRWGTYLQHHSSHVHLPLCSAKNEIWPPGCDAPVQGYHC